MTVVMPIGRALSQYILPRSHHVLTRLGASTSLRFSCNAQNNESLTSSKHLDGSNKLYRASARSYATATKQKPAGRPKAHTGKTAAKKAVTKATKGKAKATPSKKKPVKKAKTKAKAKPRRKAASPTSIKRKAAAERKTLKNTALLSEPKRLPDNAWLVYFVENQVGKSTTIAETQQNTRNVAARYKDLSPLERERLNHKANENKATNEKNYNQWLSQFSPLQIKEANAARKTLSAQKKAASKSGKAASVQSIKDERLVVRPRNAYSFFNRERFSSGDFKHLALKEAATLIGKEWKALSSSQQQPYKDQAQQDLNRYLQEHKSVYGADAVSVAKKTKST